MFSIAFKILIRNFENAHDKSFDCHGIKIFLISMKGMISNGKEKQFSCSGGKASS